MYVDVVYNVNVYLFFCVGTDSHHAMSGARARNCINCVHGRRRQVAVGRGSHKPSTAPAAHVRTCFRYRLPAGRMVFTCNECMGTSSCWFQCFPCTTRTYTTRTYGTSSHRALSTPLGCKLVRSFKGVCIVCARAITLVRMLVIPELEWSVHKHTL